MFHGGNMKLHARLSALFIGAWLSLGGYGAVTGHGLAQVSAATVDVATTIGHLTKSDDFRVRVQAAITLGKSASDEARGPLEKALGGDAHPAVRAASAAALGALGNKLAIDALKGASQRDADASVRSAATRALGKLDASAKADRKPKFLLKLGNVTNRSGTGGAALEKMAQGLTREQIARMPGVEVVPEGADEKALAASLKVPVVVLDGVIRTLSPSASSSTLTYSAKVEYIIKKQTSLKGTVKGAAQAEGAADTARDERRLQSLQEAALAGAIESALKAAPEALALASE